LVRGFYFVKKEITGVLLVVVFVLASVLAAGCGEGKTGPEAGIGKELTGSITVAGSTSVQPFTEVLAEEFMAQNPGSKINVQGGGSSQGIEAARSGAADLGVSSRELKPEEKELQEFKIARDAIAVVVHPSNRVDNLTPVQVRDIFLGQITNWKQVGGQETEITLMSREAGSGTRDGFETLVLNQQPLSDRALIANSTGTVKTMVAGDKNAIGYISMASLDDTVKVLAVDGVRPTVETVKADQYKISRPFLYVSTDEPVGLTRAFIDFVLSDAGQRILEDEGAVGVK
jgi:phosphate transport system substrate-binding protein